MISIVIPVYNAAPYLHACLDSILCQSYTDYELLLVDDGSTDDSGEICDEYAGKDVRIRVWHKKNGGVGSARNLGIDNSQGEWITFIDADDRVSESYLADFMEIHPLNPDTLYCSGIISVRPNAGLEKFFSYDDVTIRLNNARQVRQYNGLADGCPVAKLFHRPLLNAKKIRFNTDFSYNEDHLFVTTYLCHIAHVRQINAENYFYWRVPDSSSLTSRKHPATEFIVASEAMYRQMQIFCSTFNCTRDDILTDTTRQIFGTQQLVRAVNASVGHDSQDEILERCILIAKDRHLQAFDYSNDEENILSVVRLLTKGSIPLIKTYLKLRDFYHKGLQPIINKVKYIRLFTPLRVPFMPKPSPNIPKIIHLCWFSGEIPPLRILNYLFYWKIFLPDYKIMWWNKERAIATGLPFVSEAIERKKWAFAADAIRVYAVYHYGGIYMDSDIYVKKRFTDILNHDNVFFSEYWPDRAKYEQQHPELPDDERWGTEIQAAMFAAKKGSPVIRHILEHYETHHFVNDDGSLNMCPIAPQIFARRLEKYGYKYKDEFQYLAEDTVVFPSSVVAPHSTLKKNSNVAIHFCAQSWK